MRTNASKALVGLALLLLASLACNAVSSLTAGGATPVPAEQTVLLRDDFSKTDSGWGTGTDTQSSVEYDGGELRMKIFLDNYFTWSNPDSETYQNIHMEVTVKNQGGEAQSGFGLLCNQQPEDASSYYYFAVTSNGEYVIGKSASGQDDLFLTNDDNWGTSGHIPRNAPSYRLAADCGPRALALYVNGKKIDSASDTTYTSGGVGLFLWSGDNPAGEVSYDDFLITQLK